MNLRFVIVLILAGVVYSANFWGYPIYILDEAKNAACAMEMRQRNDWVVPTFNNELRTDKPPLHYYFMRAGYSVFGINAFAARLFSVLLGIGTVLAVYLFGRKLINEGAAFYAALIMICSLHLTVQFHLAVPDPYLIFFFVTGLLCFCYAYQFQKILYYYLFYGCIALAFMAKGPVAPALTGLIVLVFLIIRKDFSMVSLNKVKLWTGALLFLLIAMPWWILVGMETNGEWIKGFLFEHNLGRYTATMEGHRGIPGLAIVIVFAGMLPFSVWLPQAIRLAFKKNKENSLVLFSLIVMIIITLFFSFSKTLLPTYLGPCLPFVALLLGWYFNEVKANPSSSKLISPVIAVIISMALPVVGYLGLKADNQLTEIAPFSFLLVAGTVDALFMLYFMIRDSFEKGIYALMAGQIIMNILVFYLVVPSLLKTNPVSQSLSLIDQKPLLIYIQSNPAYIFNVGHPVPVAQSREEVARFIHEHPNGRVLTRASHLQDLTDLELIKEFEGKDLFENPVTVVLKRKN